MNKRSLHIERNHPTFESASRSARIAAIKHQTVATVSRHFDKWMVTFETESYATEIPEGRTASLPARMIRRYQLKPYHSPAAPITTKS